MIDNPYAAPGAAVRDVPAAGPYRLYSPGQVAGGAFLGGPIGAIYFLWANFRALGNHHAAQRTLIFGAFFIAIMVVVLPLLPESFPSLPITIAYVLFARHVAEKHQMTKQAIADSDVHYFHSNWRVGSLGLICLVASVIAMLGPMLLLAATGIWDPLGLY